MGYYGDCRDCAFKNHIHRVSGHSCEFRCDYSGQEMNDAYGDYPCRCFQDAYELETAEERRRENDTYKGALFGLMFPGWFEGSMSGIVWLVHWGLVAYFFVWLYASGSDAAVLGKGILVAYILYLVGNKVFGKSERGE